MSMRILGPALACCALALALRADGEGPGALAPAPPPVHEVVAVDGAVFEGTLKDGDASGLRFAGHGKARTVDPKRVVSVRLTTRTPRARPAPFNLYLANGDRLNGAVVGAGDKIALQNKTAAALRVPLGQVRAVRFGRLLGALQAKYDEAFSRALERGRDVVIVQRDTKPYPQPARVLSVGEKSITVRVDEQKRSIDAAKVFGFVRAVEPPETGAGLMVRVHLLDTGRITLGFGRIGESRIEGAEGSVERASASRIEFLGAHLAHLSDFDPIRVEQAALFGKPPAWKRDRMVLGGPLRMDGRTYARGIGVHARTTIEYVLGGRWKALFVRCGIDDAAGDEGAARFRILADGKVVSKFERRRGEPALAVELDVAGVDRLVLEALPGDSYISDFCNWAEARVYR